MVPQSADTAVLAEAVAPLWQAMRSDVFDLSIAAAEALGRFPDADVSRDAMSFVVGRLATCQHPSAAAAALGRMHDKEAQEEAVAYAGERLAGGDTSKPWSQVLIHASVWPDHAVSGLLARWGGNGDDDAGRYIIQSLSHCDHPAVLDRMRGLVASGGSFGQYWGRRCLLAFGDGQEQAEAADHFRQALDETPPNEIEALDFGALEALALSPRGADKEHVVHWLARLLAQPDSPQAEMGCQLLCTLDVPPAGAALANALMRWEYGQGSANVAYAHMPDMPVTAARATARRMSQMIPSLGTNALLNAANVWGLTGFADAASLDALGGMRGASEDVVRLEASEALAQLGHADCVSRIVEVLTREMGMENAPDRALFIDMERSAAARVLGNIHEVRAAMQAVAPLGGCVNDRAERVAIAATRAMGRIAARATNGDWRVASTDAVERASAPQGIATPHRSRGPTRSAPTEPEIWAFVESARDDRAEEVRDALSKHPQLVNMSVMGSPILCMAAFWGHPGVVHPLIENGADVTAVDKDGRTTTRNAGLGENQEAYDVLVAAGAPDDAMGLYALRTAEQRRAEAAAAPSGSSAGTGGDTASDDPAASSRGLSLFMALLLGALVVIPLIVPGGLPLVAYVAGFVGWVVLLVEAFKDATWKLAVSFICGVYLLYWAIAEYQGRYKWFLIGTWVLGTGVGFAARRN